MSKRQPSKTAIGRVRDAFDPDELARLCTTWDFDDYAERFELAPTARGRDRFYYYADNGADVLAVAHLDSVQDDGTCTIAETSAGLLACSGTLDDRLGAYVLLEMLPRLGINCDVLLTTDEEIGQSTADEFDCDKAYNWMFQFDRGGTDVVMYDYDTPALRKLVDASGAHVGLGSFSDICMLEHLGCAGFNWGVGYRDYHGPRAHAWLEATFLMVARFAKFHRANAATQLAHEPYWQRPNDARQDSLFDDDIVDIVADCGHWVNLADAATYFETDGGSYVVCDRCGTMEVSA